MNDRVQQQTLHVDKNMPFLALDQFARIEPVGINTGPPFSALFTLWLSMTQAVGLASRSGSKTRAQIAKIAKPTVETSERYA